MSLAASVFAEAWRDGWRPDPRLTVSEWADAERKLSSATSAEPANWRTSRTPFIKEPMDLLSAHDPTQHVVLLFPAQHAKSECGNNWLGYIACCAPGPTLVVQPRVEDAENYSKERLAPMVAATPKLTDLIRENRSRDGDNTILVKKFRGGMWAITGANSATGLRARPICNIDFDEVDAYPEDVDGEGDPIALALKRTTTFRRRKILYTSTPTIEGQSRIKKLWNLSDQREYYVPCPHCGNMDYMRWTSIDYRNNDPSTATLLCNACGCLIEERFKTQMLAGGEWRSTLPEEQRATAESAGFHLNALYSPLGWFTWAEMVDEHIKSANDRILRKTWVNTRLAETWVEDADQEKIDPRSLLARANERYINDVPNGVGVLVASVDVQKDRLEYKVVGYGAGEESWLIDANSIDGDPGQPAIWLQLDEVLKQTFTHQSGQKMRIYITAIDSRYKADMVFRFCRVRLERRVFAVRGTNALGQPLVGRPKANNPLHTRVYPLCTDTGKETIHARLQIAVAGPGYMHLPEWVDQEYVDQMLSEEPHRKRIKKKGYVREWIQKRDRNEAWDLEIYCLAALRILGQPFIGGLRARAERLATPVLNLEGKVRDAAPAAKAPPPPPPKPDPKPPRRQRGTWATRGRRWKL